MKRPREQESRESSNHLHNLELTQPGVTFQIKDLAEDTVASEIFPLLDVPSQLCLAGASKANYDHFLRLILQHPAQGNRNYFQRWLQHLAYEGNLTDRINQAKLTLKSLPTDTFTLSAIILICQLLLSDRRDPVLFNKVLLLAYDDVTRIEVIRFLTPSFMDQAERAAYKDVLMAQNKPESQFFYRTSHEFIAIVAWLDEPNQIQTLNSITHKSLWSYETILPPYLMPLKDELFHNCIQGFEKLNDDSFKEPYRKISYKVKGICHLTSAQAELYYKNLQRLTLLGYLKWQKNSTVSDGMPIKIFQDFLHDVSTEIHRMHGYLRRRFEITPELALEYSLLKQIPEFQKMVKTRGATKYNISPDSLKALRALVYLYTHPGSQSLATDRTYYYSEITECLSTNSNLKLEINHLIASLKSKIIAVKNKYFDNRNEDLPIQKFDKCSEGTYSDKELTELLFGKFNFINLALYYFTTKTDLDRDTGKYILEYLRTMPATGIIEMLLNNFYNEIVSLSGSDNKTARVTGFCYLVKLKRINTEATNRLVSEILELLNSISDSTPGFSPPEASKVNRKILFDSLSILVKNYQLDMDLVQNIIVACQKNKKLFFDKGSLKSCLANICIYAPISISQKNEIILDIWGTESISFFNRHGPTFSYLLHNASPDTVSYVLNHSKTDSLVELMKQRLLVKDTDILKDLSNVSTHTPG